MKHALVAEDADGIRRLIKSLLEREGYRVHEARNGSEAIDILRERDIDVALVDLMMPGTSGYRVIEVARAERPDVALIVVTAAGEVGIGVLDPSIAVIRKPFDPAKLMDSIRDVLALRVTSADNA